MKRHVKIVHITTFRGQKERVLGTTCPARSRATIHMPRRVRVLFADTHTRTLGTDYVPRDDYEHVQVRRSDRNEFCIHLITHHNCK